MNRLSTWRSATAVVFALLLAACNTPPAFQVSEPSAGRSGKVVSITQNSVQNVNSAAGSIGGALIGGGIGSLFGGGSGQTVATVVGAVGGAYAGNQAASRSQTMVWHIGVRYDDGTTATIQQTTAPALRIGDRVRVTNTSIELLK